ARNYDDMMYKMKKRMGAVEGSDTASTSLDGDDSDDEILPTGARVGDLRHGGFGASAAATLHELQLQNAVQTAMRNVHHIRENMGRELGDDPQLLATLFVAQFAGQIPEPQARALTSRPSLYRQRVQMGGVAGASAAPSRSGTMRPSVPPLPLPAGAAAAPPLPASSGPVAAVTDTNTPEGMLTRALQMMLAPQAQAAPAVGAAPPLGPSTSMGGEGSVGGAAADGAPRAGGRARPQAAKSRARFASDPQLETAFGDDTGAFAAANAYADVGASGGGATSGGPTPRLSGTRTARSMLPAQLSQAHSRGASFSAAPATLGTFGGLLGARRASVGAALPYGQEYPGVTPSTHVPPPPAAGPASVSAAFNLTPPATAAAAAPEAPSAPEVTAAAAAASRPSSQNGAVPSTAAPETMTIRRPQIHKMRSMGIAAAASTRLHTLVSGAPGEITPATASTLAAASLASTPPGSMRHRSGIATPRGDLVAAQIASLPLDRVVIFATATGIVQRLTSHVLQLLRELSGVQSDTDAMLRSTIAMIERLAAGRRPFARRAARMVPGVLVSPANSPPVSPQTEKPPGWEDAAAARVAAANAALAASVAAGGSGGGAAAASIGSAPGSRFSSLRVRASEEPEDMLPLPPPRALRGADSYNNSPRKVAGMPAADTDVAAAATPARSPEPVRLQPPAPTPSGTKEHLPPIADLPPPLPESPPALSPSTAGPAEEVSEPLPLPLSPMALPLDGEEQEEEPSSPGKWRPPVEVEPVREAAAEPEPVTVVVHAKSVPLPEPLLAGDAAAQAAAALADQEADQAERQALAEEEGLPAPPPPPPGGPSAALPPAASPLASAGAVISPSGSLRRGSAGRPSSSASQGSDPGMRLLTPPDAAHRRSGTPRTSTTPRIPSPLLPTEGMLRISPEPSVAGSRPGTGTSRPDTAASAEEVDAAPAREAVEEAGALRNLPLARRNAAPARPVRNGRRGSDLDDSVRRDEFGVEIMRLPEASVVPEASDLADGEPADGSPRRSLLLSTQPSRIAFSVAASEAGDEYDDDEDHPGGGAASPSQPPPAGPVGRSTIYVPPPSREPAAFSEPLIGTEPPSPARPARGLARILTGLPPPPDGVPAPIRRRGLSRQVSVAPPPDTAGGQTTEAAAGGAAGAFAGGSGAAAAATAAAAAVAPPQVLTPAAALQVINQALAPRLSGQPSLRQSPSRRVQLPPELERRQNQLARQQELLAAAQAAMAARRMASGVASPSRGTSRAASPGRVSRAASRGRSRGPQQQQPLGETLGLPPPLQSAGPSNAVQMAEAALERRQQEEAANKAYVDDLMERMRTGLATTGERLAVTTRAGGQQPPGAAGSFGSNGGGGSSSSRLGSEGGDGIGLGDLPSTNLGQRFNLGTLSRSTLLGSSAGGAAASGGGARPPRSRPLELAPEPAAAAAAPPPPLGSVFSGDSPASFLGPALAPIVPPPPLFTAASSRPLAALAAAAGGARASGSGAGAPPARPASRVRNTGGGVEVEEFEDFDLSLRRDLPQPRRRQAGED
ncbi:hypothetical protein PLESTM_000074600, partial [Pleodorina starrii]